MNKNYIRHTNLLERDRELLWHPFTQEKNAPRVLPIQRASGAYLYDDAGKPYLDLISSWWVNLHGHAHPEISKAIYDQALNLEHVLFAGCTHSPAVTLCEDLRVLLPPSLKRFFFSDNGSTAVEIALKMSYQYWHNQGITNKKKFLCFEGGYHGDTFGAMSVSSTTKFHEAFTDFFFETITIPFPETWDDDLFVEEKESRALQSLEEALENRGNEIAAFILEPLVQGASGMRMCRPRFINKALKTIREHNILIIFDEVMTGFGRTGTLFAMDQIPIKPDFLCLSKGITGGFLPLALTITTENIYKVFLSDHFKHAFAHGHTYTANPIACRAACVSLKLLKNSDCEAAIKEIHTTHREGIDFLKSKNLQLEKFRLSGTIAAFDLKFNAFSPYFLYEKFIDQNLLIRPLGNTIYLLPPYCIEPSDLKKAYEKIHKTLDIL